MEEIWKEVPGLNGYVIVSNRGNVYFPDRWVKNRWGTETLLRGRTPAIHFDKDGYRVTSIKISQKSKTLRLCRLVASAFIPNPNNLPCVNHKDENKTNDCVYLNDDGSVDCAKSNLEWCDVAYNNSYGSRPKRLSKSLKGKKFSEEHKRKLSEPKKGKFPSCGTPFPKKPVTRYSETGDIIGKYPSLLDAARETGINFTCISKCCLGKQKRTADGSRWAYAS